MENWEKALDKFVNKWKDREDVTGMIVCGSYITGNPSAHSDIDIHIVLSNDVDWRERGNEIIDGFLMEYFANPLEQHIKYFEKDFEQRRNINVHMFQTGKILFDKTGELENIINIAKEYEKKDFEKSSKIPTEIAKYHIWDMYDNLEEIADKKSDEFFMVYYTHLEKLLDSYSAFLGFESINPHKIKRFLSDPTDQKKYNVKTFPDQEFVNMYVESIPLQDIETMMGNYKKITNHVLDKMGGFNIDGWKIKTPLDI